MKKLFTLVALLAVFLGAKAIQITDAEVNYSDKADGSDVQLFSWRGQGTERLSVLNGCLHYHGDEVTENPWGVQFFPIGNVDAEDGVTYFLEMKIKGSGATDGGTNKIWDCNFQVGSANHTKNQVIEVSESFQVVTLEYNCTANGTGHILFQCGNWIGDLDIEYMKIYHEGKEQKPVEWKNLLTNGDASGEYGEVPCAYSKEYGVNNNDPHAADIVVDPADANNKVFKTTTSIVEPPLTWDEAGEQWGQKHEAGDPKPDNAWQNQFWISLPESVKEGTQLKLMFKVKASEAAKADIQTHAKVGDYVGGFNPGSIDIGTDWTPVEAEFAAPGKSSTTGDPFQSIAFNLGVSDQYKKAITFYFDELQICEMVLEHGYFVAASNAENSIDYDFDHAIKFEEIDEGVFKARVGTQNKQDSWVNEVMISTVRGNDKAYKSGTIKLDGAMKNDKYVNFTDGSNAKIKLLSAGVWDITINTEYEMIKFTYVEGDPYKEPIEISANPTEIVVNATERDWKPAKADGTPQDGEEGIGTGQPWDNQFWIIANRPLVAGEETVVEFDYVAASDAKTSTQDQGIKQDGSFEYIHYDCIGDVNFTTEEQHFKKNDFVIKETFATKNIYVKDDQGKDTEEIAEVVKMQGIVFNLSEIKDANTYTIKNIKWYLKDETESLIDMEGTKNFFVKIGANTNPYQYGTDPSGIQNVTAKSAKTSTAIYNLAGQRVANGFKGIVIKDGKKFVK